MISKKMFDLMTALEDSAYNQGRYRGAYGLIAARDALSKAIVDLEKQARKAKRLQKEVDFHAFLIENHKHDNRGSYD